MLGQGHCILISPWPARPLLVAGNRYLRETGTRGWRGSFPFWFPYLLFLMMSLHSAAAIGFRDNWFQFPRSSTLPESAPWCPLRRVCTGVLGSEVGGPGPGPSGPQALLLTPQALAQLGSTALPAGLGTTLRSSPSGPLSSNSLSLFLVLPVRGAAAASYNS